jgi:hypothetical protein
VALLVGDAVAEGRGVLVLVAVAVVVGVIVGVGVGVGRDDQATPPANPAARRTAPRGSRIRRLRIRPIVLGR